MAELRLDRCPHCNIAKPYFPEIWDSSVVPFQSPLTHLWSVHVCSSCSQMILVRRRPFDGFELDIYPRAEKLAKEIPDRARRALSEAIATQFAPGASIMTSAQAVDYMLKERGFREGDTLNARIKAAVTAGVLTPDMELWANEVRFAANDERHKDTDPTPDDAAHSVQFALALAEFLFVLPARVKRGIESVKPKPQGPKK
jgi:Domain of unknown function (DUF4145)